MGQNNLHKVDDYDTAVRYLSGRDERPLAHNTTIRRVGDDVAVRYHWTDIVTYHPDGTITLHDGGWPTVTTTMRLHALTPGNVRVRRTDGRTAYKVTGDLERYILGPTRIEV